VIIYPKEQKKSEEDFFCKTTLFLHTHQHWINEKKKYKDMSISEVCLVSNSEEPSLKWLPAPRLEPMGPHLV
jgi:hypothetical protein